MAEGRAALVHVDWAGRRWPHGGGLAPLTLDVFAGEVLGVVGPNGGGKSTLLLLMAGLLEPTSGEVRIRGERASQFVANHPGEVGFVAALPGLYPLFDVRENLGFFGALLGVEPADLPRLGATERLGVDRLMGRRVADLSTGERQRVALSRALLGSPPLLVLDEPTANVDAETRQVFAELVRELASAGIGVVWATHDLDAAEVVCERIAIIREGLVALEVLEGPRRAPAPGPLAVRLAPWLASP